MASSLQGKKLKPMGIYALEELDCGCKIKHYKGGKTITIGCKQHHDSMRFICGVCGEEFTKLGLKEHQWVHAV